MLELPMLESTMIPKIELTDKPTTEARDAIIRGLGAFNEAAVPGMASRPLAVVLSDPETGAPMGGLWGRTAGTWLFVELLFIPEEMRRNGLGRKMMATAEEEARARACRGVWLDTFSFQARGFYEKLGYSVFGAIENFPPGHARYFLKKDFA